MMAPYAIAHMKIGLKLAETGYRFGTEERARIYLTNALEPWVKQLPLIGFDALAHEAAAVNEIKRHKRFTVVIGNPPYSINSANASIDRDGKLSSIGKLVEEYKLLNGESINERNPKALQDDYVKFTRLAEEQICASDSGILGMITNHGYLENPTFRGMRFHLMDHFDLLHFLDLHGNAKKKEVAPDGTTDENVFDILQGVAIMLAAKTRRESLRVRHGDLWGKREHKYNLLLGRGPERFADIKPCLPLLLFVPQDTSLQAEYEEGWPITEVFAVHGHGVKTHRDDFAIAFDKESMTNRIRDLRDKGQKIDSIRARYFGEAPGREFPAGDNAHWKLEKVRQTLQQEPKWEDDIVPIHYRPFDWRYCFHNGSVMDRPRSQIMRNMRAGKNLALITTRQTKPTDFRHILVTRSVSEVIILSPQTSTDGYVFPAYRYSNEEDDLLSRRTSNQRDVGESNLTPAFTACLTNVLGVTLVESSSSGRQVSSEEVLFYFYALLHSESLRQRYSEFLKRDFPRLPLTENLELFRALARLGGELTALHLLESPKLAQPITEFIGSRNSEVEKVSYSKNTVWIDKAQTIGFKGVREGVWNFHIGGYQVCEKWLKDRKNRKLSKEDISHYQKVVVALSETIRLMKEVDTVIDKHGGWPGAFSASKETAPEVQQRAEANKEDKPPPIQQSFL
jgi:predicted helicase